MAKNEIHFRNTDDCIKKIKSIRTMYRDTTPSYVALSDAIQALEEIRQCREYKEIFESHFSEEALKLLSNKEEFGKWLERGRWIAKKCDEINRELEQYRAIGTVEQLEWCKDASHWKELFKEKLAKYEAIGTVEEFKALKDKSVAKKPYLNRKGLLDVKMWHCPVCKKEVASDWNRDLANDYCHNCGQKLDWQ